MSGIAGIVNWHNHPVEPRLLDKMTTIISHRGPNGVYQEVSGQVGLGYAKLELNESEESEIQPLWLPDKSCAIVADVRLYNRTQLIENLKGFIGWYNAEPSDAAIILSAYGKWDVELLDKIDGDFAFAIWDSSKNIIFAARDPFGVKPFFYSWRNNFFIFGSEPKQIHLHPEISTEPDDMIVGEYLFNNFEDINRTFFKHVRRLKPSCYLLATKNSEEQIRYWNPDPDNETIYPNPDDYLERFKELFVDSVRKRLINSHTVTAQLSGGVDSSAIVVAAGSLYNHSTNGLPEVETISAVFGDLSCDESVYIDSVLKKVPFRNHKFNPLNEPLVEGLMTDIREIDSPFVNIQRGTFLRCEELISDMDSRILLTGMGGDELTHEEYYLRDLAQRGKFLRLLYESWLSSKTSWNTFGWLFTDAIRSVAPGFAKRLYRTVKSNVKWQPPDWAESGFLKYYNTCPEPPALPRMGFKSQTQEAAFQFLNFPRVCLALEALECHSAYKGFEVRHPFLDRPLAEFVLSIPFEMRIPHGQWKYLLRKGLSDELSTEVINRSRKTMFTSYNNSLFKRNQEKLRNLLFNTSDWASGYYVSREKSLKLFQDLEIGNDLDSTKSLIEVDILWRIATVELWMRHISML